MKISLKKIRKTIGWLAFLLPIVIVFPHGYTHSIYDVVTMALCRIGLFLPIVLYVLCLIDVFHSFPRKEWGDWLLVLHLVKVPLFILGLFVWYSILLIGCFISNGLPPQA